MGGKGKGKGNGKGKGKGKVKGKGKGKGRQKGGGQQLRKELAGVVGKVMRMSDGSAEQATDGDQGNEKVRGRNKSKGDVGVAVPRRVARRNARADRKARRAHFFGGNRQSEAKGVESTKKKVFGTHGRGNETHEEAPAKRPRKKRRDDDDEEITSDEDVGNDKSKGKSEATGKRDSEESDEDDGDNGSEGEGDEEEEDEEEEESDGQDGESDEAVEVEDSPPRRKQRGGGAAGPLGPRGGRGRGFGCLALAARGRGRGRACGRPRGGRARGDMLALTDGSGPEVLLVPDDPPPPVPGAGAGKVWAIGKRVRYFSRSHQKWIGAMVLGRNADGTYDLTVKKRAPADHITFAPNDAPVVRRPQPRPAPIPATPTQPDLFGPRAGNKLFRLPRVQALLEAARKRVLEALAEQPGPSHMQWLICIRTYGRAGPLSGKYAETDLSCFLRSAAVRTSSSNRIRAIEDAVRRAGVNDMDELMSALKAPEAIREQLRIIGESKFVERMEQQVGRPLTERRIHKTEKGLREQTLAALEQSLGPLAYRRCLIFVAEEDADFAEGRYAEALAGTPWADRLVKGVKGAHFQVRFIEESAPLGTHIIVADDNIEEIAVEVDNEDELQTRRQQCLRHYRRKVLEWRCPQGGRKREWLPEDDLDDNGLAKLIIRAARTMREEGANLWGVSPSANHLFLRNAGQMYRTRAKKLGARRDGEPPGYDDYGTELGLVYGAFFGFRTLREARRYTRYGQVKDDVERTLRYWHADGVILRYKRYGVDKASRPGTYSSYKGGISAGSSKAAHQAEGTKALKAMLEEFASPYAKLPESGAPASCGIKWIRTRKRSRPRSTSSQQSPAKPAQKENCRSGRRRTSATYDDEPSTA
eukprot:TRINITY_DN5358_c1_g1_i2.p1 TRINITY_DN5358_c1_g1~~TRINITY_DN5358_c1_g1_i2.p1  ORF type:complete len:870 (-),score=172.74 TRINITY_DN5358_c1_g1_i2:41-2650(-)